MADKTEGDMNLAAIKRVDPYAKSIVGTSSHVAFYTFNSDENEWEKTDIEGAFFIYHRNAEPFHSIFINNRLNTNSFVEPITGHLELQSQPPFLLYRNERSRIRGFWFYSSQECDRIGQLVGRLIKECEGKTTTVKKQQIVVRPAPNAIDIFSMLSKAQEDFNNSQANQAAAAAAAAATAAMNKVQIQDPNKVHHPHHHIQSTSSSTTTTANNQPDVAFPSVKDFFAAAKPAAASEVPLFQRLLSNPVSVDQIEKQQRATTPQERSSPPHQVPHSAPQPPLIGASHSFTNAANATGLDNGFGMMRINSPKPNQDLGTSPLAKFLGGPSGTPGSILTGISGGINTNIPNTNNVNIASAGVSGGTANSTSVCENDINSGDQKSLQQLLKSKDQGILATTPPSTKPALMPPTMFLSSSTSKHQNKDSILSPGNLTKPEPLTQTQLLQAMMYLIQNDPEFIKKLHEAYLKSFTEMVSL